MNKFIVNSIFFLIFILLTNCSFDNKTGIWEEEDKKVKKDEKENLGPKIQVFTSSKHNIKELIFNKKVKLEKPVKNISWSMPGMNLQNNFGNLHLTGINKNFLKKQAGKNKFNVARVLSSPIIVDNNIVVSNNFGTIYKINERGKIIWKINIYKKINKKFYKNLSYIYYKNKIFVSDNLGFIYALSFDTGTLIWKKRYEFPFKTKIKIFNDKIFLVNQQNKVLCLDLEGKKIWDIQTVTSFIKSQNFLGLSVTKHGELITINSAGDILKASENGKILWSMNSLGSLIAHDSDFFSSSNIVITDEDVLFSTSESTFSLNLENGYINWNNDIASSNTPIVVGNNVFLVSDNGYFINLNLKTGKPIWSTYVLKILKKKKQNTFVSGFILGSDKAYITTQNGYLIICSASTGKIDSFKKIASSINSSPIIANGELFVLTGKSKLLGFK